MVLENKFYIGFDKQERKIVDIGFDGYLMVHSNPFVLNYCFKFSHSFESGILNLLLRPSFGTVKSKIKGKRSLDSIDHFINHDIEHDFKVEVKKGKIYLQDKLLQDYLQ